MIVLTNMFPNVLTPALQILDQGKVTKFVCEKSKRSFYRVKEPANMASSSVQKMMATTAGPGGDSTPVLYFDIVQDFSFSFYYARECLTEKGNSVICKYVLAARLAEAMKDQGMLEIKIIEDNDFAPLLLSAKSHL